MLLSADDHEKLHPYCIGVSQFLGMLNPGADQVSLNAFLAYVVKLAQNPDDLIGGDDTGKRAGVQVGDGFRSPEKLVVGNEVVWSPDLHLCGDAPL